MSVSQPQLERITKGLALLIVFVSGMAFAANKPPKANWSYGTLVFTEGMPVNEGFPPFVDPEGQPLTYSMTGQPSWLRFDASTRTISGTPPYTLATKPGKYKSYKLVLRATDPGRKSGKRTINVRVYDHDEPLRLVSPIADKSIPEDAPFIFQIPATMFMDPEAKPFSVAVVTMPSWLAYDSGTRTLSGVPSQTQVGVPWNVVVRGTDASGNQTTDSFVITVTNVNDAPRITVAQPNATVDENQSWGWEFPAHHMTDDDGDAIQVSILAKPSWATVIPPTNGYTRISGTATTANIGTQTVTFRLTDPHGAFAEGSFTVTVRDVNQAPVFGNLYEAYTIPADQPWTFTLPADYASDPDGDPITYFSQHRGRVPDPYWVDYDPATRTYTGHPRNRDAGVYRWTIGAQDPAGLQAMREIIVEVTASANRAPTCATQYLTVAHFVLGQIGSVDLPYCGDPEGEEVTISFEGLPPWLEYIPSWHEVEGTPPALDARGTPISIIYTDPHGASITRVITIVVLDELTQAFGVTATASTPSAARVDSDVNDPRNRFARNDSPEEAQFLPRVPAIIGGFIAATPTGHAGDRFETMPDLFDGFEVELTANTGIELIESEPDQIDVDLYLFEVYTGELVDFSIGSGASEGLRVPSTGRYRVVVSAESGHGNYFLYLGLPSEPASQSVRATMDFVAGEAVVMPKPGVGRGAAKPGAAFGASGARVLASAGKGPMRLALGGMPAYASKPQRDDWRSRALASALGAKVATARALKALRADPTVASADPNYRRLAAASPTGGLYWRQWALDQIGVTSAWSRTNGSNATVIAVVDTGVHMSHPAFAGKLLTDGYDLVSDPAAARDGDGIDPDPDDPGDAEEPGLRSYHGTHVTGIIAADGPDNEGTAGVAWDARILPVRVLGQGGGTSFDVIQGIRYAAGLANAAGTTPAQRANIINLSLGGGGWSQAEQDTIDEVRAQGIFVVAAAGNEAHDHVSYPAGYDGVIAVGAIDLRRGLAPYSSFGIGLDLVAPGGDTSVDTDGNIDPDGVYSTMVIDNGTTRRPVYAIRAGTSMAAPHVAGVIALMLAVHPDYSPGAFDADLSAGLLTEDLGLDGATTWHERYGYGSISASKAVARGLDLAGGGASSPLYVFEPSFVSLTVAQPVATVRFTNRGQGGPRVIAVSGEFWFGARAVAVDAMGFGDYELYQLPDRNGAYRGHLTFIMDDGTRISMPVRAEYPDFPPPPDQDAGVVYLTLLDPVTYATVAVAPFNITSGSYYTWLRGVPPGEYLLVVGTDRDNDQMICDSGEACGGFPTLDSLQTVTVHQTSSTEIRRLTLVLPQPAFGVSMSRGVQMVVPSGFPRTVSQDLELPDAESPPQR